MEITLLSDTSLILRTKTAVFVVDPGPKEKEEADASLFLSRTTQSSDAPGVVISGPGEYEVGGIKISGTLVGTSLYYVVKIGTLDILIARMSALAEIKEKAPQCKVLVVNIDSEPDQSAVSEVDPKMLVAYGEDQAFVAKLAGGIAKLKKVSIKQDKLPQEMETVALG